MTNNDTQAKNQRIRARQSRDMEIGKSGVLFYLTGLWFAIFLQLEGNVRVKNLGGALNFGFKNCTVYAAMLTTLMKLGINADPRHHNGSPTP